VNNLKKDQESYYNPDDYLLGHILYSLKENAKLKCFLDVQCWRNRQLILLPHHGRAYTDLTDRQFKTLGITTLDEKFSVQIKSNPNEGPLSPNLTVGLRSISIKHLIWGLALQTARGRVPEGTDLSLPFYLQSQPDFPETPTTQQGLRIANLWTGNHFTLDEIAQKLNIDKTDVYSFYSAAVVTGWAAFAIAREDPLIVPGATTKAMSKNKPQKEKEGFFASILRRIGKR